MMGVYWRVSGKVFWHVIGRRPPSALWLSVLAGRRCSSQQPLWIASHAFRSSKPPTSFLSLGLFLGVPAPS